MSYDAQLHEFMLKFLEEHVRDSPGFLAEDHSRTRLGHLEEELDELKKAFENGDLAEFVDGLVDLSYIAIGTAILMGVDFDAHFREVHRCNMMKERAAADGSNSKRGTGFDVIKPEWWTPPDHDAIIRLAQERAVRR